MLEVAEYNWDDVPEPSLEDLAEIDAAMAVRPGASELMFAEAWLQSWPVEQALKVVGEPDGTAEWRVEFVAQLFAHTEAIAAYKLDSRKAWHHASEWHDAVAHSDRLNPNNGERRVHLPIDHLKALVEMMPLDAVARYLSDTAPHQSLRLTPEQVEQHLFPLMDMGKVHAALRLVQSGVGPKQAAARVGISYCNTLRTYMKAMRVEAAVTVTANGQRRAPAAVAARIRELMAEGLGPKAIQDKVNEEHSGLDIAYAAVKMVMQRARKAA